jgi:rod shape determining protein RodA
MEYYRERLLTKLAKLPVSIPFFVSLICIYGFAVLYSASGGQIHPWAYKQIMIFCASMPAAFIIAMIDLNLIFRFSYLPYIVVLILLVFVELFGKNAMGGTRWLDLGLFRLQPSEPAKIAIVLMLAGYFHKATESDFNKLSFILIPAIAVCIPVLLIIKQPDLGTGVITLLVAAIMFFATGIRIIYFIISGILAIISLPVIWLMLYDYQRNRVLIFINPEMEPLGAGYNIIQSKIAIGSGGLLGKGLFNGTQSHLNFLPVYETDFIFSFLAEELGFIGGALLLLLYLMVIVSSLAVAINCRSRFAKLMSVGITSIFFSHIFINIAMVMGLLPVVGVPLPLVSYGGTMMVSMLVGFGLIMNAGVNRHTVIRER